MFQFLKEKLKKAVSTFSKRAEQEADEGATTETELEIEQELKEEPKKEAPTLKISKEEKPKGLVQVEKELYKIEKEVKQELANEQRKKKGLFEKIFGKKEASLAAEAHVEAVHTGEEEIKKDEVYLQEEALEEALKSEIKVEGAKLEDKNVELEAKALVEGRSTEVLKKEEKSELKEETEEEKKFVRELQEKIKRAQLKPPKDEWKKEREGIIKRIAERVTTKKISGAQFEEFFWELEVAMLENNIAVEVIEKIKEDLKREVVNVPIKRGRIQETIFMVLKESIKGLFKEQKLDLAKRIEKKKPFIICFVGINGSGKTTTIAKFANMLKKQGKTVVLAASDTFRAAAIDQLEMHANKLGIKIIKQDYGSDAAAVAFDAIKHAEAKKDDTVLIDTAGRMHSNTNLVDEMKKIVRVAKPDLILFIGESITGNDCVEQAKRFNDAIGIDGIVLSKADVDEKGGAAISISYVTKKPILYLGVGQGYDDLEEFNVQKILNSIGLI